ncbi:TetR/AcrR family transcriptional regulator [Herbidospora sp. NBRC 101105]|uniref:TetR/AcrR family transcriptional regulator n=1 Tax=Herbidospora sp. NBRC 101105 TaxID=3032195 RepID=UPI0024A2A87F|nr:TetR/AcrR family transcriptional regulator [Herbidospora sp. NBRC 101105]GLX94991.1 TetR family transcriptional regulator [Herbidospora sp. NBRC 101105]
MVRAGLTPEIVVDHAMAIVDEHGPAAVTLSAVAARAGVATPSLYKHVRNLAELTELVSIRVMDQLAERGFAAVAGRSGEDALRAYADAWRGYVKDHPGRYAAMIQTASPELSKAGQKLVDITLAALRSYGLEGEQAIHATRAFRAAVHGFVTIEAVGGFGLPYAIDESYHRLIGMVIAGLPKPV